MPHSEPMTLSAYTETRATAPREAPVADWVSIPQLYEDPFPTFERLRAEGGIHWVPAINRYLITSYAAVHDTELDQETYSANEENSLMKRAMGHSMLRKDDPEHHPERRAYMPTLKPATVQRTWKSIFQRNARVYLDELTAKGPGADLVWDFAAPYTAESLRAVTGLHNVTQQDMQRWSQCLIDATGNYSNDPDVWARGEQAFDEVDAAIDEMISWHVAHPDDSLLSGLLSFPEFKMPLHSIRANLKMTIGGGLNEPRDAIGVAAWALMQHPEQRAQVEQDAALWNSVFDEGIRWVAPIGLYSRQTTREVDLQGVRLPAGARLGICLLSANRDETEWPDPERFDINRKDQGTHLAFGKGVHVCAGAWVARAQVADVALPMLFRELPGLRLHPDKVAKPGGWVFRGMDTLPVTWDTRPTDPSERAGAGQHLAIVGAGPAGCYSAQALRRELPGAQITIFDQRPAPYGLVRSGVAGDHQGTKTVTEQFARLFEKEGVRFLGSTRVHTGNASHEVVQHGRPGVFGPALRSQDAQGAELTLEQLRSNFDAVVVATGLQADVPLGIPGSELNEVYGAGRLTRWLNGDPTEAAAFSSSTEDSDRLLGETTVLVGMGNVALDLVRLLAKRSEDLTDSDVFEDAHSALTTGLSTIHVLGRSAPIHAKFDPAMLREVMDLEGIEHVVHGVTADHLRELSASGDTRSELVDHLMYAQAPASPRLRIEWWFQRIPTRVVGSKRVDAVTLAEPTSTNQTTVKTDSLITAIGFTQDDNDLLSRSSLNDATEATSRVAQGLYVAGWLRRGPRGTIPSQRADARQLAAAVAEDLAPVGSERRGLEAVLPFIGRSSNYEGWLRIDSLERQRAPEGRVRSKMTDAREQRLLATAALEAPRPASDDSVHQPMDRSLPPLTVLFGTESGNAELTAQTVASHLAGRFSVSVKDLDETSPEGLDVSHPHVVICSTYGEGKLPTSAQKFHQDLSSSDVRLEGLQYAMFGMGDRSYHRTYSRGSEILDSAFQGAGAQRIGGYGRHDAAGPESSSSVACSWMDQVLDQLSTTAVTAHRPSL